MDAQTIGWVILSVIVIGLTIINMTTSTKNKHKRSGKHHA